MPFPAAARAGLPAPLPPTVADLRTALRRRELCLHYQPVVSLVSGRPVGVEALLRWEHPRRGLLLPGAFLPVAESSGLVTPIGQWVIEEACRQAVAWREELGERAPLPVHVNVSARQLMDGGLVDVVECALATTGAAAPDLAVEVTETVLMEDGTAPVELLESLKRLGVTVLLDDFGVGYSSLSYLRRFPVDVVKIDRSFVAGLGDDAENETIVLGIIDMARRLGRRVLAEGIETEAQRRRALALGCHRAQGFLFGRPVPAGRITALMQSWRGEQSERPGHDPVLAAPERLVALRRSALLDSPAEDSFDTLAQTAADLVGAPIALVSVVAGDRQFFKSAAGSAGGQLPPETPLSHSFCRHVVGSDAPLVVDDARACPLVRDNPAIEDLGVAAYAGVPLRDGDGNVLGALCVIDRSPRRWADGDVQRLERLSALATSEIEKRAVERRLAERDTHLRVQGRVLDLIARNAPLEATLNALIGVLEDGGRGVLASVLLLDGSERRLQAVAHPSLPRGYVTGIDGLDIGPAAGACGAAAAAGERVISPDIASDPRWSGFAELALGHGLRACWSIPIRARDGHVLGTFAVYSGEPREPTVDELDLAERAADLAAIAIERNRDQEIAVEATARFSRAFDDAPVGMSLVGMDRRFMRVNARVCELLGAPPERLLGRTWGEFVPEEETARCSAWAREVLEDPDLSRRPLETRIRRADGRLLEVSLRLSAVRDPRGRPKYFLCQHMTR